MYKRILLKLSGEALSGDKGFGLDEATTRKVAQQVKEAAKAGAQIAIVIGGGNFWRGRSADGIDRVKADQIGMLGTVMNCLYVSEIFRTEGMETAVYTPYAIGLYTEIFNKDKAVRDLESGKIVFFAGGTGHPFFSTDMGTALRAAETDCEIILMAKSIDGVYDSDPAVNPQAVRYEALSFMDVIEKDLKVMDLTAATLCKDNGISIHVFAIAEEGNVLKAICGEKIGTIITDR